MSTPTRWRLGSPSIRKAGDGASASAKSDDHIAAIMHRCSPPQLSLPRRLPAPRARRLGSFEKWDLLQAQLDGDDEGFDVRAGDAVGRTALHYASGYGNSMMAAALIKHGAVVDAPDRFGVTPLHWACLKAHVPLVHLLLRAAADPLRQATKGVFSRHSAIDLAIRADAQEPGASTAVTEALTAALGGTLFEQRKVLGRGGFGTIIKAVRRDTGVTVALKEVRKAPGSLGDDLTDEAVMADGCWGSTPMVWRCAERAWSATS